MADFPFADMVDFYFEDAVVGFKTYGYDHHVTEEEIIDFAKVWDPMPFHIDVGQANKSIFGGLTASGAHVYSIFNKLCHNQDRKMAIIAALGVKEMSFDNPVRPGDTLHLEGECISSRESASKKDRGICEFLFKLINQNGEIVFKLVQPVMIAKKANADA